MMPRLGAKYAVEIEVTSKPIAEYQCDEYFELGLPVAPAIMVDDEIVVEGSDISQDKVESAICRCLGLPEPEQEKKGYWVASWGDRTSKVKPSKGVKHAKT